MYSIDKEKFGAFVAQLRKEKGLMQKELAEKLYVSDKAVSKWERGLSVPDVGLLVPLAELLGVSVTELLEGRRIPKEEAMDSDQTEELVQKVIGMTAEENRGGRAGKGPALALCTLLGGLELCLMEAMGIPWEEIAVCLGTVMLLMAIFGVYFCVLARERLPKYYDENRIAFISDGFLRMNLPGVYFNNNNWPHILRAAQLWCLLGLTLTPVLFFLLHTFLPKLWNTAGLYIILFLVLGGLFIPMTVVARKYEYGTQPPPERKQSWAHYSWVGAILLVLVFSMIGGASAGSGLKVGWSERKGPDFWRASYAYYDGWRKSTINRNETATTLYAEVVTESGALGMTVTDEAGNIVFSQENLGTDTYEIPLSGRSRLRITAEKHKGQFSLYWK